MFICIPKNSFKIKLNLSVLIIFYIIIFILFMFKYLKKICIIKKYFVLLSVTKICYICILLLRGRRSFFSKKMYIYKFLFY